MKKISIAILLCLISTCLVASPKGDKLPEVSIKGSQVRTITSVNTNKNYDLWISPPQGYEKSTKNYPVIFLLDAQWDFTLMVSLYGQLYADGDIPAAILVGVTWNGEDIDYGELRVQDFLPLSNEANSTKHGADKFISFFDEELIPYIDKEYRTTDERVLVGSSFAGWFSLYTLFNRPDLFNGFLVTAPTVQLIESYILTQTKTFAKKVNINKTNLYMAIGERDSNLAGFKEALELFEQRNYNGLNYHAEIFKNMGHSSVKGNGNTRGLQFLFKKIAKLSKFNFAILLVHQTIDN